MSLFGSIFGSSSKGKGAKSSLFSDSSSFKSGAAAPEQKAAAAADGSRRPEQEEKKKKSKPEPDAVKLKVKKPENAASAATAAAPPAKRAKGEDGAARKPTPGRTAPRKAAPAAETPSAPAADESLGKKHKKRKAHPVAEEAEAAEEQPSGSDAGGEEPEGEENEGDADAKRKLSPEEEAERLKRTLFVGNLPPGATRKALKRLFSQFGRVASARIRSVPLSSDAKVPRKVAIMTGKVEPGRGAPHGYVVMESADSVAPALALNMTVYEGHHLRVDKAAPPSRQAVTAAGAGADAAAASPFSSSLYDPKRSVFVGNLPFHVKDEELIAFFEDAAAADAAAGGDIAADLAGALEAVRVVRDPSNNIGKGFAFVLFKTKAAFRAALDLDGKEMSKRKLRITRVSAPRQGAGGAKRPALSSASALGPGGGRPRGAAGRLTGGVKSASWQGVKTKGVGKGMRSAGPAAASGALGGRRPAAGGGAQGARRPGAGGDKGRGGALRPKPGAKQAAGSKRPSVAARKDKQRSKKQKKSDRAAAARDS